MSHYEHGAIPESLKQQYLAQMLDFYKGTSMQHKLRPEEYTERIQLPFLSNTPSPGMRMNEDRTEWVDIPGDVPETTVSGTRYVTSRPEGMPENLSYGHVGPDYVTMMNIMKAQQDPNFNIGFMSDAYMKERPNVGAYFSSGDQTIAFNPNKMLDWDDPRVQGAFSTEGERAPPTEGIMGVPAEEKERNLALLEGTTLNFDKHWNQNVAAHELGHYGTYYRGNTPSVSSLLSEDGSGVGISNNKFEFPNWTQHINMTKFDPSNTGMGINFGVIKDKDIRDVQGHNMAYWVGRGHDWDTSQGYNPSRDMYLNQQGAENYDAWRQNAQNYIRDYNNPPVQRPTNDQQQRPTSPAPPINPHIGGRPRREQVGPPGYNYNSGGIAGLPGGQWSPSTITGDEEIYDIKPLQMDPGIMSIEDLEDLFEEVGLDKRLIYNLINTGGLSQFVV